MLLALLPPMPLGPQIVLGLLGTLFAGLLNLVFRRARIRWSQFALAFVLCPIVILTISKLGLNSGLRTGYVFFGAVVGLLCIRGTPSPGVIPYFHSRAAVVMISFVILGPVIGLAYRYLFYQAGLIAIFDAWEIQVALEEGVPAGIVGCLLGAIMLLTSVRWNWAEAPPSPSKPSPN